MRATGAFVWHFVNSGVIYEEDFEIKRNGNGIDAFSLCRNRN